MRYKKIPNTDMNISSITVGTWAIGADGWGDVNTKDSIEAIHAMVDKDVYKRQLLRRAISAAGSPKAVISALLGPVRSTATSPALSASAAAAARRWDSRCACSSLKSAL